MLVKANVHIFGSLILATIFGTFGQTISYFINENIAELSPIYYLTVLTITSVFLYLVSAVLTYFSTKKQIIDKNNWGIYFFVIGLIGVPISLWSLFVLAMWWS